MSEENKTPETRKSWYYFFTKETHEPKQFATDEDAIEAGKGNKEVISILRARDSHYIWQAAAAIIIALMLLLGIKSAKATPVPYLVTATWIGGTNVQVLLYTNITQVTLPPFNLQIGGTIGMTTYTITNANTAVTAAVSAQNLNGGTNFWPLASNFYPFTNSPGGNLGNGFYGTNGFAVTYPPVTVFYTNIYQVVFSTGTNNIPATGTYGN